MKAIRFFTLLLCAALLCAALPAVAEAGEGMPWRGYDLQATWLTTNKEDFMIPNLRDDGQFAMIRLQPVEGTISYDLVNEHGGEGIFLRLAGGEEYPVANVIFHKFLPKDENSDSIFPSIDPEQDNFEALFFLEGKDESALEGAALVIEDGGAEQTVALDAISREKPE